MQDLARDREAISETANPLGLDGIEFIDYATSRPRGRGQVLKMMGFRPVARHRWRAALLYRQGDMNGVIKAHVSGRPSSQRPNETPVITAVALRVRDAAVACQRASDRGTWAVPTHVAVTELNIPAIHGVGASRLYFVDRTRDLSIWDVDFVPIPTVGDRPAALAGLHWFGIVQCIGIDSFPAFAHQTSLADLDLLHPRKTFPEQLADFMWHEIRSVDERITTARHFRVCPGEGVHSEQVADLVMRLAAIGYRGDHSLEVFHDDYQQMLLALVAQRARASAEWRGAQVLRRSTPLANRMRQKAQPS